MAGVHGLQQLTYFRTAAPGYDGRAHHEENETMLKTTALPLPLLAVTLAALRARMTARPMRGAMLLGSCAGTINCLVCVPLALAAMALLTPQQLGGSAVASLEGTGTAMMFWMVVVWAPLFETVLGQWLPIELLRRFKVPAMYCLLASASLFSLGHVMSGAGFLHGSMTFIAGCTFAASYLAARSMGPGPAYVAAATAHASSNGLLLCLSLLFPGLG
jgi:hypothetical protein